MILFQVIKLDGEPWNCKVAPKLCIDYSRNDAAEVATFRSAKAPFWEKAMAPHSSTLAWRLPGTVGPGGLPSTGLLRVGHNCRDLAGAAKHIFAPIIICYSRT